MQRKERTGAVLKEEILKQARFEKFSDGLIPAIVQDHRTRRVLMLGYMSRESLEKTLQTALVTFYSRSRNTLWTKGETSGNVLHLRDVKLDCDSDALLVLAEPAGPVCHTGEETCFFEENTPGEKDPVLFLTYLQQVIQDRKEHPVSSSYTNALFEKGVKKISQKVGEESVELILEAMDENRDLFLGETADLLYHLLVLLVHKECTLEEVMTVLKERHGK